MEVRVLLTCWRCVCCLRDGGVCVANVMEVCVLLTCCTVVESESVQNKTEHTVQMRYDEVGVVMN